MICTAKLCFVYVLVAMLPGCTARLTPDLAKASGGAQPATLPAVTSVQSRVAATTTLPDASHATQLIAPSDVATAAVSDTFITITWSDAGQGAGSYVVAKTSAPVPLKSCQGGSSVALPTTGQTVSYQATGLAPGTKYLLAVCAVDASNSANISAPAQFAVTTLGEPVDAMNLAVSAKTTTSITLAWQRPQGQTVTFKIASQNLATGDVPADCTQGDSVGDVTSYTVTGLKAFNTYGFRVCAVASANATVSSAGVTIEAKTDYGKVVIGMAGSPAFAGKASLYVVDAAATSGNSLVIQTLSSLAAEGPVRGLLAVPGGYIVSVARSPGANVTMKFNNDGTRVANDFLVSNPSWIASTFYQDLTMTADGHYAMATSDGHVHFYDQSAAEVYDLALNSDHFRAVSLNDGRIASVSWSGAITATARSGTDISSWQTPTLLATTSINEAFGLDYCADQNKLIVAHYGNGSGKQAVSSCDVATGICTVIVSDYSNPTNAGTQGYALRVDPRFSDCSFYLAIQNPDWSTSLLHYNGDGSGRQVFAAQATTDPLQKPYGLDFQIDAP